MSLRPTWVPIYAFGVTRSARKEEIFIHKIDPGWATWSESPDGRPSLFLWRWTNASFSANELLSKLRCGNQQHDRYQRLSESHGQSLQLIAQLCHIIDREIQNPEYCQRSGEQLHSDDNDQNMFENQQIAAKAVLSIDHRVIRSTNVSNDAEIDRKDDIRRDHVLNEKNHRRRPGVRVRDLTTVFAGNVLKILEEKAGHIDHEDDNPLNDHGEQEDFQGAKGWFLIEDHSQQSENSLKNQRVEDVANSDVHEIRMDNAGVGLERDPIVDDGTNSVIIGDEHDQRGDEGNQVRMAS